MDQEKVTVYACSGCSDVAQIANSVAVRLDRSGIAKMSCIAGVGGDVVGLVRFAEKSKRILVLDGCPLACAAKCLARHNITPSRHMILTSEGLVKNEKKNPSNEDIHSFFEKATIVIENL